MFIEVTDINGVLNMVNVENIKVLVESGGKKIKSLIWFSDTHYLGVQDEYEFLLEKIEKVLSI